METLNHPKAIVTFEQQILWIKFNNGIEIDVKDMKEIYDFAMNHSGGNGFAVLFDSAGTEMLKEEVVEFVAKNPDKVPIRAKAYITETVDHQTKARLHMAFDQPQVRPGIFSSKKEAVQWLQEQMKG